MTLTSSAGRKAGVAVGKAHPFGMEIAFRKMGPTDFVIVPFDGRVLGGFPHGDHFRLRR
jgi:hypothetical protein